MIGVKSAAKKSASATRTRTGKGRYTQAKTPIEFISQRISISESGCWIWIGPRDRDGYGQVQCSRVGKDAGVTRAHQLSWFMVNGKIPKGMCVCHKCDIPECVNPEHLFLGTAADNNFDKKCKGRNKNGSKPNPREAEIVAAHGKMTCHEASKLFGYTFSYICYVWRKHGKSGRSF